MKINVDLITRVTQTAKNHAAMGHRYAPVPTQDLLDILAELEEVVITLDDLAQNPPQPPIPELAQDMIAVLVKHNVFPYSSPAVG